MGWLHKCPAPGIERGPSANRARRRLTLLIETNTLPLRQTTKEGKGTEKKEGKEGRGRGINTPNFSDVAAPLSPSVTLLVFWCRISLVFLVHHLC